jgi:hypothetical protein
MGAGIVQRSIAPNIPYRVSTAYKRGRSQMRRKDDDLVGKVELCYSHKFSAAIKADVYQLSK